MIDHRKDAMMDSIRKTLIDYADEVNNLVSSGRTDIVVDAEHVFRDLLNTMYGYNLTNANQTRANFPAVDLIDGEHGVAVQITSTNARQKADRTVDTFLRYDLEKGYPTLIYLILTFAPPFRNADQLIHKSHTQGVDLRIMTLLDIYYEIEQMPFELVTVIAECLDKHIGLAQSAESEAGVDFATPSAVPSELSEICQQVFRLASILPSEGLRRTVFEHGLCLEQKKAVDDLIDCNLLKEKGAVLLVYPYYRYSKDFTPSSTECQNFLEQLWHYESSWQWDKVLWRDRTAVCRSLAQLFATAADIFPEASTIYAHRSAELWRSTQDYRDALHQEQRVLANWEAGSKKSWDVARARHFTGECHTALREHDLALKDWEITLTLCKHPLRGSPLDLAEAFHNVGKAELVLKEYDSAEAHLLSALKLFEKLRKKANRFSLQLQCAEIYNSMATLYDALDRTTIALECNTNAQTSPNAQKYLWEILYSERHIRLENLFLRSALDINAFVGREAELEEIGKRFETTRVVILSGLGGTGKTELAVRYGMNYESAGKGLVYFVQFQESLVHTVVNEISRGIPDYHRENKSEEQVYNETMAALRRCWKSDLLILDNVNQENFSILHRELGTLPLQILITTRQDIPRAIHVSVLDRAMLYAIFRHYGVNIPKRDMDALIDAVNGHTLTVDLIARTMRQGSRTVTTEQLLTALQSYHLTDGFSEVSTNFENSLELARISEHLRTVFQLAELPDLEQELLRCATLLPQEGIDADLFLVPFADPDTVGDALDDLIDKGWLQLNGGMLCIHPVIRIVCIAELEPTDESCDAFLEGVREQYDPSRYDHVQYTQMAALFTEASTVLEDREGFWAGEAGYLRYILGDAQKALECNLRSVAKLEKYQPNSGNLATAYSNVGGTYNDLGDHTKALEYQMKAHQIFETVLHPDHPNLAVSCNNVGISYSELGNYAKALEYKLKALDIRVRALPPEHPDLAASFNNVGLTYGDLGDHEKALEYLMQSLTIQEQVLPLEHPDLATSYSNVGSTYRDMGDYARALEYQLKALSIREMVLPSVHPDLAQSYRSIGSIYSDLGDHRKALEYSLKAMAIQERVLPANHPGIVYAYVNVGHSYGYLDNYPSALGYLEKALAIAEKVLPPEHPHLELIRKDVKQYREIRNMVSEGSNTDTPAADIFSDN